MSGIFDQVINYAPPSLLLGTVTYKGTWSAATNTPTLPNPPSAITNGNYYVVSAAGTQFSLVFNIGDWIISNGSAWEKVDNTDAVSSVFGRTGAVVGVSTDYSAVGITATAVGASSPSTGAFTTLSATTPLAVASGGTGVASSTGTTNVVLSGSPTITTPVIAQINDANGNETLKLASIASAVNEVTIENAATGNAVHISATGGDASVGLHLAGKGASGYVNVQDSTDATKRIMFNASGGTTNTRTMLSSTQTVDRTLSLPDATDTLVGRATTDTLTNKTLTSPTITGGALNGTLGATTPSTIAGTSGTFTGNVVLNPTTTEAFKLRRRGSTSVDTLRISSDASADLVFDNDNSIYHFQINGSEKMTLTTTGLNSTAIGATTVSTGAFSTLGATGLITASANGQGIACASADANGSYLGFRKSGTTYIGAIGAATQSAGVGTVNDVAVDVGGANHVYITTAQTIRGDFTAAGLAVTGTGSFTSAVSISANAGGTNGFFATQSVAGGYNFISKGKINSTIYYHFQMLDESGSQLGLISSTTSLTTYGVSSDYRLKNITGVVTESGTFIDALKPKVGTWKVDGSKFVGFLAHEFVEVSPSSVVGKKDAVDADGKPAYQSMQASTPEVMANIVAELQSLRKRLAALEAK